MRVRAGFAVVVSAGFHERCIHDWRSAISVDEQPFINRSFQEVVLGLQVLGLGFRVLKASPDPSISFN